MIDEKHLLETGGRFADETLIRQAELLTSQLQQHNLTLSRFGLTRSAVSELEAAIASVISCDNTQESLKDELPRITVQLVALRGGIARWRGKLKLAALLAFQDSDPEMLRHFRIHRFDKQSMDRIVRGMELLLGSAREYQAALAPFGVSDAFIASGRALLDDTKSLLAAQAGLKRDLPESSKRLNVEKGKLYQQLRRISRIGQLAFYDDIARADAFRLSLLLADRSGNGADIDDAIDGMDGLIEETLGGEGSSTLRIS